MLGYNDFAAPHKSFHWGGIVTEYCEWRDTTGLTQQQCWPVPITELKRIAVETFSYTF